MDVVAAALVVDARVLAARRVRPAGGWEFPGGKVEVGESAAAAIERECAEELAVPVRAVRPLASAMDERITLQLWLVELVSGTPMTLTDHDALRWLAIDELDEPAWLAVDRELLPAVRELLAGLG